MSRHFGQLISNQNIKTLRSVVNTFGRHPNNSFRIDHPSISKFHCIIEFDDDSNAVLIDKGSLNGSYVNGDRVAASTPIAIASGDMVKFGMDNTVYRFLNFMKPEGEERPTREVQGEIERTVDNQVDRFGGAIGDNLANGNHFDSLNFAGSQQRLVNFEEKAKNLIGNLNKHLTPSNISDNQSNLNNQLMINLNTMIFQLESEIGLLQDKIKMQEGGLLEEEKKTQEVGKRLGEMESGKELAVTKQEAIQKFIIELQKQFTDLERSNDDKQDKIDELCDKDWAKNMENIRLEEKHLDRILKEKQAELANIQKYATNLLHTGDGSPNVRILEEQSKELTLVKRHLIEFENRNNDCQRKWKDLYRENITKDEYLKGLRLQLDRQSELHQQLYTEFDKKYYESQNEVANLLKGGHGTAMVQDQCSDFIVEEVKVVQDEIDDFNTDNAELRVNYNDLEEEVKKLENQKDYFSLPFDSSRRPRDASNQAILSLRSRIYELIDLSEEMKHFSTQQEIQDLKKLCLFLEQRLSYSKNKNNRLAGKIESIRKFRNNSKEENTIDFFAKLLEQKDKRIRELTGQLEEESKASNKNQDDLVLLKSKLEGLTGMCYDISDAQKKISNLVFTKKETHDDLFIKNEAVTNNNVFVDQHHLNENPGLGKISTSRNLY